MTHDRLEIVEMARRLANLIRIGSIAAVDPAAARAKVTMAGIVTASLPWLTTRAGADRTWWCPSVGEQVVVLSPGGDLAQGIILPALYATAAPAPSQASTAQRTAYADGTVIEHDNATKVTRISALEAGGTLVLEAKNVVIRTGDGGSYLLDHAGYAQRLTHLSGSAFESESWHTGAVITGLPDAGFAPPAVHLPEESE